MEAAYLAKQAGFGVTLLDKDPLVPAMALADDFCQIDLLQGGRAAEDLLREFDLIIPATENYDVLLWLHDRIRKLKLPVALDMASYNISSSKKKSNRLFNLTGIPIPGDWPECDFPVIVKPSNLSGSLGVEKVNDQCCLWALLNRVGRDMVIQEFLQGPSYSLEVIAHKGKSVGLQVTELRFDFGYDCKRVMAGPAVGQNIAGSFLELGDRIACILNLSGIMDIEVIDTGNGLKVLEIDARLPSQTPSAVYHSTGINIVELLADYWVNGRLPDRNSLSGNSRAVIYEHLRFRRQTLEVAGEHILNGARGLKLYRDKFMADVVISNFVESPDNWVATVIFTDSYEAGVWDKRNKAMGLIMRAFNAVYYSDPEPYQEGGGGHHQVIL